MRNATCEPKGGEAVAVIADSVNELDELARSVGEAIGAQRAATLDIASRVVKTAEGVRAVANHIAMLESEADRAAEAAEGAVLVAKDVSHERYVSRRSSMGLQCEYADSPVRASGSPAVP